MVAPYLALRIAPFCYASAVLLVLPILAIRPSLRRPSYVIGVIWGVLSAWTAVVLFAWAIGQGFPKTIPSQGWLNFGAAGAASGLLYTFVVRQRRHAEI